MRAFVFTDKALAKHAGQFVWLSIDTENAKNAAFSKKYPIRAWPSLYVIDPVREKIALRWVGGATVSQLEKLFADGTKAVKGSGTGSATLLAKADALYGDGHYAEAGEAYKKTLETLPPKDPQYPRVVESLLFCYQTTRDHSACAALARSRIASLKGTQSGTSLAGSGLDCSLALPPSDPSRAESVAAFAKDVRAALADPSLKLAEDDRSALYSSLFDERDDAKDAEGAQRVADAWVADLDAAASRAQSPEQRTALDPNRLGAFEAAKRIEDAIPMLEQSEKDFPKDYNPPARLAVVYLKLQRYDDAKAAADRALERVYGPRRIRVLSTIVDIQLGKGDRSGARKTLEEAVTFADGLPEGQRSEEQVVSLRRKLDAL
ncbi:MAG TPA: thioredoxin family protein [Thermoanaerobaculia bacterium]